MTDSEYVFQQDIKERKSQVNGARHRKCGSKSKKVHIAKRHADGERNQRKERRSH